MSNNTGNTLLALITGAAIGAGIGILFAPDKGENTRKKLKKGFDDAKHDLSDKVHAVKESLLHKVPFSKEQFEGNIEEIVSKASHKTEDVIVFLEDKLADLKAKNAKFQK